ncbi:MAG: SMI1/KNR4 family protein, partial [Woeseiaceae bacterium]
MDLPVLLQRVVGDEELTPGNSTQEIADAESRIGRRLPGHVVDFYAVADGARVVTGIGPLADVRKIDPGLFTTGILQDYAYEGIVYFSDEAHEEMAISVSETADWLLLGSDEDYYSFVFLDPDATGADASVFELSDYGVSAYGTVRQLLEERWVNEQVNAIYDAFYEETRANAMNELEHLAVKEIVAKLPKPSLIERIITREFFAPAAAEEAAIATAENRIGRELPDDYRAFLEIQNGHSYLSLLPIETVQPATSVVEASIEGALFVAEQNNYPDFDLGALEQCWVIGGQRWGNGDTVDYSDLSASLYWCPEQRPDRQYLDTQFMRFHATFTDVVREFAADSMTY